jgi:hypothetical protein
LMLSLARTPGNLLVMPCISMVSGASFKVESSCGVI